MCRFAHFEKKVAIINLKWREYALMFWGHVGSGIRSTGDFGSLHEVQPGHGKMKRARLVAGRPPRCGPHGCQSTSASKERSIRPTPFFGLERESLHLPTSFGPTLFSCAYLSCFRLLFLNFLHLLSQPCFESKYAAHEKDTHR
jgi:hypothetical protein